MEQQLARIAVSVQGKTEGGSKGRKRNEGGIKGVGDIRVSSSFLYYCSWPVAPLTPSVLFAVRTSRLLGLLECFSLLLVLWAPALSHPPCSFHPTRTSVRPCGC